MRFISVKHLDASTIRKANKKARRSIISHFNGRSEHFFLVWRCVYTNVEPRRGHSTPTINNLWTTKTSMFIIIKNTLFRRHIPDDRRDLPWRAYISAFYTIDINLQLPESQTRGDRRRWRGRFFFRATLKKTDDLNIIITYGIHKSLLCDAWIIGPLYFMSQVPQQCTMVT